MNARIPRLAVSFGLLLASPLALHAQGSALQLVHDAQAHVLHAQCNLDAGVLLVAGQPAVPAIQIGGIEILVRPDLVVPLGVLHAGDHLSLDLPAEAGGFSVQLVAIDLATLRLHASNAVSIAAPDDLDFHAELAPTPEGLAGVAVRLTAPTSGHELRLDGTDRVDAAMHVYLRLIAPGPDEIVIPVLEEHRAHAAIDDAERVEVYLMREARGQVGMPAYVLMASLRVPTAAQGVR